MLRKRHLGRIATIAVACVLAAPGATAAADTSAAQAPEAAPNCRATVGNPNGTSAWDHSWADAYRKRHQFNQNGPYLPSRACIGDWLTKEVVAGEFDCSATHCVNAEHIWGGEYRYFRKLTNGQYINEKDIAWH